MKKIVLFTIGFWLALNLNLFAQTKDTAMPTQIIAQIYKQGLNNSLCYEWLRELSVGIGARLSGSEGAEKAVLWAEKTMKTQEFDKVYLQEVMVPKWERGNKESAMIWTGKKTISMRITALGGSVATPEKGLTAEVIAFKTLEELEKAPKEKVQGKIVFINRKMNPSYINTFEAYSDAVMPRVKGAIEASKKGAVGMLIRSITMALDDHPHTGSLRYDEQVTKIPAGALSTLAANKLWETLEKNPTAKVSFTLSCSYKGEVLSHNVIGEITGSQYPNEYITVGGHLDSWDNGNGAHDDGAGCVQSIEALRIYKQLGIKPKHSIRAVMFMNEENGLRGGKKYYEEAKAKNEIHLAAIESDAGGFTPKGFDVEGNDETVAFLKSFIRYFEPYQIHEVNKGGGGADISYLRNMNCVLIGLRPDSHRYFDYHHTEIDVFENVNKRELELGASAIASLIYLIDYYGIPTK